MPRRIKTDASENILADLPADLDVTSPTGITAFVGDYTGINIGVGTVYLEADSNTLSLTGNAPDISLMFGPDAENITFGISAKTSNTQPQNLSLQSQFPFATATGANRKPGDIILNLGAPTNSGVEQGNVSMVWGGSERMNIGWDGSEASINCNTQLTLNGLDGDVSIGNSNSSVTIGTYILQSISDGKCNTSTHSVAGYTGLAFFDYFWYGTTTNSTPTIINGELSASEADANSSIRVVTEVLGTSAAGTEVYSSTVVATYRKASGTLSLVSSVESNKQQSGTTSTAAAHVLSGGKIMLQVSGSATSGLAMRWEAHSSVYFGKGY